MTEMLREFPAAILLEARASWEIAGSTASGGRTTGGRHQVVSLDGGGLWMCELQEVMVFEESERRLWTAMAAICDGGAQPVIVPRRVNADVPWGAVEEMTVVGHSDDATFSDGTGYFTSAIEVRADAKAELRATEMTIDIVAGGDLEGGEHFSINHVGLSHRMYRVRTIEDNGDGTWDITFRPPLRAMVPAGTELEFARPKCVMTLLTSDAMSAVYEAPNYAKPTVRFIEAFPPFP